MRVARGSGRKGLIDLVLTMIELLKEFFDAAAARVRSPIFGSVLFSILAFNWQPLAFVIYNDAPLKERFAYWDENFCLTVPLLTGVFLAFGLPWVTYIGSFLAKWPNEQIKSLQAASARSLRIKEFKGIAEEEEAKRLAEDERSKTREHIEQNAIKAEQRIQKARELSEDLSKNLEASRRAESDVEVEEDWYQKALIKEISQRYLGMEIFTAMSQERNGRGSLQLEPENKEVYSYFVAGEEAFPSRNKLEDSKVRSTLEYLEEEQLIEVEQERSNHQIAFFRVSDFGNKIAAQLQNLSPEKT